LENLSENDKRAKKDPFSGSPERMGFLKEGDKKFRGKKKK